MKVNVYPRKRQCPVGSRFCVRSSTLFDIYLNDILTLFYLFADDTNVLFFR